jgi:hypothetical protein
MPKMMMLAVAASSAFAGALIMQVPRYRQWLQDAGACLRSYAGRAWSFDFSHPIFSQPMPRGPEHDPDFAQYRAEALRSLENMRRDIDDRLRWLRHAANREEVDLAFERTPPPAATDPGAPFQNSETNAR